MIMKALKRLSVAFVLLAGLGIGMASCSEDAYYEEPVQPLPPWPENPIQDVPSQPPVIDPR